ncbi:MAG: SPOR domain-containing protein [Salinivenus sp.]
MVISRTTLPVLVLLVLCACSGPSQSQPESGPEEEQTESSVAEEEAEEEKEEEGETEGARAAVADFESFDPSAYQIDVSNQTESISHQVPSQLLSGRADEGVRQSIEGFRVQVFSTEDQESAQDVQGEVQEWWEENEDDAPQAVFRSSPPIVMEYSQPYYRVRIGAFAERAEAEEALEFIQEEYDGAFIVRSSVTVVR